MQNVPKPQPGPLCAALEAWIAQAKKGERFEYFRGPSIDRILMTPEQRMTKQQRAEREIMLKIERAKAKKDGKKFRAPPVPDEFKEIKPDVMALVELVEGYELRGLVDLRCIVLSAGVRSYEMSMNIQRNGLPGVRAREAEKFYGAA